MTSWILIRQVIVNPIKDDMSQMQEIASIGETLNEFIDAVVHFLQSVCSCIVIKQ